MDWTAAGVVVSGMLALAAIAVQQANRRTDRQEAAQAARDAADRADRAVAAAERSAAAAEAQAVAIARSAPVPQVAWTVEFSSGDAYLLTNAGDAAAFDVDVDAGDMGIEDGRWPQASIGPGEGATFLAAPTLATADDTVTVTWADEPGGADRRSWRRSLPPGQTVTVRLGGTSASRRRD